MTLVYLTAQKYPSKKADPFYRLRMAEAFARVLGKHFTFVVRAPAPESIAALNALALPVPRRLMALWYFVRLPFVMRANRWSHPEVVLFTYDPYLAAAAIFWRRRLRLRYRVAFDWHQLFEDWRDRYVARGSDYCIATSKRLAGLVAALGVAQERLCVAYGGVDPAPYEACRQESRDVLRARLGLPNRYLIGYVGGFTSVRLPKGLDTMLAALAALPPQAHMVLVGGLPNEIETYQALAQKLGVADRCTVVPRQPFAQVVEYECAMDALVIPYPDLPHYREWGFPMKVWEYMAAGRPIVYSDLVLIAEVLAGRGTPFKPDDPASLAAALAGVMHNMPEAEGVAAHNATMVEQYTWQGRAQKIAAFVTH